MSDQSESFEIVWETEWSQYCFGIKWESVRWSGLKL